MTKTALMPASRMYGPSRRCSGRVYCPSGVASRRPVVATSDRGSRQTGQQDQGEDAAHAFEGLDAHVFDIEALFLVKAVSVLDVRAAAPLGVDLLGDLGVLDGDVGEQNDLTVVVQVIGDQRPGALLRVGQAERGAGAG